MRSDDISAPAVAVASGRARSSNFSQRRLVRPHLRRLSLRASQPPVERHEASSASRRFRYWDIFFAILSFISTRKILPPRQFPAQRSGRRIARFLGIDISLICALFHFRAARRTFHGHDFDMPRYRRSPLKLARPLRFQCRRHFTAPARQTSPRRAFIFVSILLYHSLATDCMPIIVSSKY